MQRKQYLISDRPPAVAGKFYPADSGKLFNEVNDLFATSKIPALPVSEKNEMLALVVPHAGYVFSGKVMASAFAQIKNKNIERIFLIGVCHSYSFEGASVFRGNNYVTPLGKVAVDTVTSLSLLESGKIFSGMPEAHIAEHSLEVQLPFLQYILGNQMKIVPILLGTTSVETIKSIAKALKPFFKPGNLFVVSTDLSHYPSYDDAVRIDHKTVEALCKNNVHEFLKQLKSNKSELVHNLATSMCGWPAVLALLYITETDNSIKYLPIRYMNSGDAGIYGEKSRVVGYQSIAIIRTMHEQAEIDLPEFTEGEKSILLQLARQSISEYFKHNVKNEISLFDDLTPVLKKKLGVFVSITVRNKLRGCMGRIEPTQPLYQTVREMSIAAAYYDQRFEPVSVDEFENMKIEISILSHLKKVETIDEIELGRHGILIRKGDRSGTYLPDVATKTGWSTLELITQCSRDKAHIGSHGWETADIFVYETIVMKEEES